MVVNALDYPKVAILPPPLEYTPLPEFQFGTLMDLTQGFALNRDTGKADSGEPPFLREMSRQLSESGVDVWQQVRRHLTDFEYQVFELRHKYQYPVGEIAHMMDSFDSLICRTLIKATNKLRRAYADPHDNG